MFRVVDVEISIFYPDLASDIKIRLQKHWYVISQYYIPVDLSIYVSFNDM